MLPFFSSLALKVDLAVWQCFLQIGDARRSDLRSVHHQEFQPVELLKMYEARVGAGIAIIVLALCARVGWWTSPMHGLCRGYRPSQRSCAERERSAVIRPGVRLSVRGVVHADPRQELSKKVWPASSFGKQGRGTSATISQFPRPQDDARCNGVHPPVLAKKADRSTEGAYCRNASSRYDHTTTASLVTAAED